MEEDKRRGPPTVNRAEGESKYTTWSGAMFVFQLAMVVTGGYCVANSTPNSISSFEIYALPGCFLAGCVAAVLGLYWGLMEMSSGNKSSGTLCIIINAIIPLGVICVAAISSWG